MRMRRTADELWERLTSAEIARAIAETSHVHGLMRQYQKALLYRLAQRFNGGEILEIGCYHGASALIMSMAAPEARIMTISPDAEHVEITRRSVAGRNVAVAQTTSMDLLKIDRTAWDMIHVDGNHKRAQEDVAWFNRLAVGGLILFHDYTPAGAKITIPERKSHPEVVAAVDRLGEKLGRRPDVLVVDEQKIGMAGFYRGEGETWK